MMWREKILLKIPDRKFLINNNHKKNQILKHLNKIKFNYFNENNISLVPYYP